MLRIKLRGFVRLHQSLPENNRSAASSSDSTVLSSVVDRPLLLEKSLRGKRDALMLVDPLGRIYRPRTA